MTDRIASRPCAHCHSLATADRTASAATGDPSPAREDHTDG
ncbi:hypothetical protein [Halorubrum sp. BV1]|nr:hypothetical protein [Halorubrum sp. BV1]